MLNDVHHCAVHEIHSVGNLLLSTITVISIMGFYDETQTSTSMD